MKPYYLLNMLTDNVTLSTGSLAKQPVLLTLGCAKPFLVYYRYRICNFNWVLQPSASGAYSNTKRLSMICRDIPFFSLSPFTHTLYQAPCWTGLVL